MIRWYSNRRFCYHRLTVTRALMLGSFLMTAEAAHAGPVITPTAVHAGDFEGKLAALSQQGQVGFVAEGIACKSALSRDLPQLSGISLSEKVRTLAAAYDYDAQPQGRLFILRKRYTNPHDLPPVTLPECVLAVEDVKQVLSGFHTDGFDSSLDSAGSDSAGQDSMLMTSFAPTLTASQMQAISSDTLTVADLTPEQRRYMTQAVACDYVTLPAQRAAALLKPLQQAMGSALCARDEAGHPCFGLRTVGGQHFSVTALGKDGTDWLKEFPATEAEPQGGTTLGHLTEALNARQQGHFTVESSLADIPVTTAGLEAEAPDQIFQAVAALYGFRVRTARDGMAEMRRPLFRVPLDVGAVAECVRRVLPLSLQRALHCDRPVMPGLGRDNLELHADESAAGKQAQQFQAQYESQEAVCRAAVQYLWSRTVAPPAQKFPLAQKSPAACLPVTDMKASEQRALSVALMTPLIETLTASYLRQTPEYVAHFDQLHLVGGLYWNPNPPYDAKLSLGLAAVDPATQAVNMLTSFEPITIPAQGPNPEDPANVPTLPSDAETAAEEQPDKATAFSQ